MKEQEWKKGISMKGTLEVAETMSGAIDMLSEQYTTKLNDLRKTLSHLKAKQKKQERLDKK